jgi:hypothetical protein
VLVPTCVCKWVDAGAWGRCGVRLQFNAVDCQPGNPRWCCAVGEGFADSAEPGGRVHCTQDGGATWWVLHRVHTVLHGRPQPTAESTWSSAPCGLPRVALWDPAAARVPSCFALRCLTHRGHSIICCGFVLA